MRSHSLRGRAAVAAVATVGALCVPLLAAAPAAAAAAVTQLTFAQETYWARTGTTVTIQGTVNNTTVLPDNVYWRDAASGSFTGTPCNTGAQSTNASFSCSVPAGATAKTRTITAFYSEDKTGTQKPGDATKDATLIVAGIGTTVAITAAETNAGQGQYLTYSVKVTDADGSPVPGAGVTVTGTEPGAVADDIDLGPGAAPATLEPANGNSTSVALTMGDGIGTSTAGQAKFHAASHRVGTVTLTTANGDHVSGGAPPATATLIVSSSTQAADVTAIAFEHSTQNYFTNKTAQLKLTLTNTKGQPVTGVTPTVTVTAGPDKNAAVTVGATDAKGQTTASYTTGAVAGSDTVTAAVNSKNATTTVVVVAEPAFHNPSASNTVVPTTSASATLTFTLTAGTPATPQQGYALVFVVSGTPGNGGSYTVTPGGLTDANGQVKATVANPNPKDGDIAVVTATLLGDAAVTGTATAKWEKPVTTLSVTPPAATSPVAGTSATFTVSATDQFGKAVSGLTFTWSVAGRNNPGNNIDTTGTGASFSYPDKGAASPACTQLTCEDTVTVQSSDGKSDQVKQYWVSGNAQATTIQAKADNQNPLTTDVSKEGDTPATVTVTVADTTGNSLIGTKINLTSTGVGVFTDASGDTLASPASTVAYVDVSGHATAYVRSAYTGTQVITATTGTVTTTATVTYEGQYQPVTPIRVADTRTGQGGIGTLGGQPIGIDGKLAPNTLYRFDYANSGMPLGAQAYAFNITAIGASGPGNLRVAPGCGSTIPSTSLLNYQPGKDVANFAIVPNGCNSMLLYTDTSTVAVAIDLVGYYESNQAITTVTPYRVVDTRSTPGATRVAANGQEAFQVGGTGGTGGIPSSGAKAVALNVTVADVHGYGDLRIFADGVSVPLASSVNYIPGVDKAAFVIVDLPANGKIRVQSDGVSADVIIDAYAYFPATSNVVTQAPVRIMDTRHGLGGDTLASNVPVNLKVTGGTSGVPADAQAVLMTITSIHTAGGTGIGNLRVYPTGGGVPVVSTLNYVGPNSDVANFAIVKPGAGGQITLFSNGSAIDVAVDVVGYIPAGS